MHASTPAASRSINCILLMFVNACCNNALTFISDEGLSISRNIYEAMKKSDEQFNMKYARTLEFSILKILSHACVHNQSSMKMKLGTMRPCDWHIYALNQC